MSRTGSKISLWCFGSSAVLRKWLCFQMPNQCNMVKQRLSFAYSCLNPPPTLIFRSDRTIELDVWGRRCYVNALALAAPECFGAEALGVFSCSAFFFFSMKSAGQSVLLCITIASLLTFQTSILYPSSIADYLD